MNGAGLLSGRRSNKLRLLLLLLYILSLLVSLAVLLPAIITTATITTMLLLEPQPRPKSAAIPDPTTKGRVVSAAVEPAATGLLPPTALTVS